VDTAIDAVRHLLYLAGREVGLTRYNYRVAAYRLIEAIEGERLDSGNYFGIGFYIDDGMDDHRAKVMPMIEADHWPSFGWAVGNPLGEMTYYFPEYVGNFYGSFDDLELIAAEAIGRHLWPES
jgi:hypothetical protein